MTIKELKEKLCAKCSRYQRQPRTFAVSIDENDCIIYKKWASKCHLKPITEDGKECPYFQEME